MNVYVNDFNTTVQTYYSNLKKYKPIDREKESELFNLIKKNDSVQAKNEIIESNLKFVFNVAKKYKGKGVPLEDLISEGNIGLTKAIDKFDNERGIKFISYAVWWIKQSIQECLNKRSKVVFNEVSEEENVKVIKCENVFDDEIVEYSYETTTEYDDMMNELNDSKKNIIVKLLNKLPSRGKQIIKLYYGLDGEKEKNLEEIGNELGITKERVRQLKEKSLKILRSEMLFLENYDDLFI